MKKGDRVAFTRYTSKGTPQLVVGRVVDTHEFCKAVKVSWVANIKKNIVKHEWLPMASVKDASGADATATLPK